MKHLLPTALHRRHGSPVKSRAVTGQVPPVPAIPEAGRNRRPALHSKA